MRVKHLIILASLLASIVLFNNLALAVGEISVKEIIKLVENGVNEETIRALIVSKDATFNFSTKDLVKLKEKNVPETLVNYMINRKPGDDIGTISGGTTISGTESGNSTVNITIEGEYTEKTTLSDMSCLVGIAIDDKIKAFASGFDEVAVIGDSKRYYVNFSKSISSTITAGDHEVEIKFWDGQGTPDASKLASIYTEKINAVKDSVLNLKYELSEDKTGQLKIKVTKVQ
jgi:hypothetical protein